MPAAVRLALLVAALTGLAALACAPAHPATPPKPPPQQHDPGDDGIHVDDARVQKILEAYTTSMSTCPERVWRGHDWSDNRIVLLQKSTHRAWVWSGAAVSDTGEVSVDEVDPATLPPELSDFDFFSQSTLDGANTLGIDLDETAPDAAFAGDDYDDLAVLLAFHEGFHFLGGQDDFVTSDTGGRDPVLPLDWHPRFLRAELIASLHDALTASDPSSSLAIAKHWQQRYDTDAAEDRQDLLGLDVIEGTAQYVESVAAIVAKLGCDASDADIVAEAAAHASQLVLDAGFDSGGESYAIGPAAGLLLRAHGQDFEEAAKTTPMAELLLQDVTAADVDETAPDVAAVSAQAESAVGAVNDQAEAELAPLFATWDDASTVRLALPTALFGGSFAYEQGFVAGDRADQAHVLIHVQATWLTQTGSASVDGVDMVEDVTACGDDVFAIPVDASARTGDTVTVSAGGVDVTGVTVREVTGPDGRIWWCAE